MRTGRYLAAIAAMTLAAVPALAAPVNPAASLSLSSNVRAGSHSGHKNELAGGGLIIALIAAAAVVVGVVVVADNNSSN